jgi:Holliday junction resolvase RusA-like endonuclease
MDRFFVPGAPIPQGSLKFINGHAIHARAADLATWRAMIYAKARETVPMRDGAVYVGLTFVMRKPKTVKRELPFVRPDIDKLVRAVLDGLTGAAYVDDEQVCVLAAEKVYGEQTGCFITIGSVNESGSTA